MFGVSALDQKVNRLESNKPGSAFKESSGLCGGGDKSETVTQRVVEALKPGVGRELLIVPQQGMVRQTSWKR